MVVHIRAAAPAGAVLGALALLAAGCGTVHAGTVAAQRQRAATRARADGSAAPGPAREGSATAGATAAGATARPAGTAAPGLPVCAPNPGGPMEAPGPLKPPVRTPAPRTPASPEPSLGPGVTATMKSLQRSGTGSLAQPRAAVRCRPECLPGLHAVEGNGAGVIRCLPVVGGSGPSPHPAATQPRSEPVSGSG